MQAQDGARRVGIITAIEGWRLTGAVRTEPTGAEAGRSLADAIPQFGTLVRMKAAGTTIYGLISKIWLRDGASAPGGRVWSSSTREFQALQAGHWPAHLVCVAPQDWQTSLNRTGLFLIKASALNLQ